MSDHADEEVSTVRRLLRRMLFSRRGREAMVEEDSDPATSADGILSRLRKETIGPEAQLTETLGSRATAIMALQKSWGTQK